MANDSKGSAQLTVDGTILSLKRSLRDYIEAAYHISDPLLVEERVEILNEPGVISQLPFIETTPKFKQRDDYTAIGLDPNFTLAYRNRGVALYELARYSLAEKDSNKACELDRSLC